MGLYRYWQDPDVTLDDLHVVVFGVIDALIEEQYDLRQTWLDCARIYLNRDITWDADKFLPLDLDGHGGGSNDHDILWNGIRSLVDSHVAHVTMNEAAPKAQTSSAAETTQLNVQRAERFGLGILQEGDYFGHLKRAVRLADIIGHAEIKGYVRDSNVAFRVLRADQVLVDHKATGPGELPASKIHRDRIDRGELRRMFADDDRALAVIENAPQCESGSTIRDQVEVAECYARAREGRPGRHCIALRTGVLFDDQDWDSPAYPMVKIIGSESLDGYYGTPLILPSLPAQREINFILYELKQNIRHLSRAFIHGRRPRRDEGGTDDPSELLDTTRYAFIEGTGPPPTVILPPIMNAQVLQVLQMHWAKVFEVPGMNELLATATKPAGLESGEALRTFRDIGSTRLSESSKRVEQAVVDGVEVGFLVGEEIHKAGGWKLLARDAELVDEINWAEINEPGVKFYWSVRPASALPNEPTGRAATLRDAMRDGLITRDEARALSGWSDLSKSNELAAAPRNAIETIIEKILLDHEYTAPRQFMALDVALELGQQYINLELIQRPDNTKGIDMLEQWVIEVSTLMQPPSPTDIEQPAGDIPPPPGEMAEPGMQMPQDMISGALPADPAAAAQLAAASQALGPPQGMM